jgi:P27 family predicted phage terminase small subunit
MKKGRKPTSKKEKELKGTHQKCRDRGDILFENSTVKARPRPSHLDRIEQTVWKYLYSQISEHGNVTTADTLLIESICSAYSDMRKMKKKLEDDKEWIFEIETNSGTVRREHPAYKMKADAEKRLRAGLNQLSARFNVSINTPDEEENPFNQLLQNR